jgi:hypothetical protein
MMLVAGSEKEAAHRVGLSHTTVKHHHGRRHAAACAPHGQAASVLTIVIRREGGDTHERNIQVGAPLQSTIARLS